MNYQTGDYIRFHTPEQWEQIVEKLERDGQRVYKKEWERGYLNICLDPWGNFSRNSCENTYCKNDITDKFFEELLQEDLCNNPPLEVGDEFVVKWYNCEKEFKFKKLAECDRYDIDWVDESGDTQYYTHTYDLEKLLNQGTVKILSYKQANPKQEYSVKPKTVSQVNWKELQETYAEFSIEQSKKFMENWLDRHIKIFYDDSEKRLISLSGKACPRYYSTTVTGEELLEMFGQDFTLAETTQWYFAGYATSGKSYDILIDMADQYIYQNIPHSQPERVIAIKTIKSMEGVLDLDGSLEKLDMISDSEHSMLIAEALNEEEYQKWLKYVESHHKMMLEVEKEYRAECFKYIESLK